jgi:hypothetical protein
MQKAARGNAIDFKATAVGQGLALDVGLIFQTSKNKNWAKCLMGINKATITVFSLISSLRYYVVSRC